MKSPAAQMRTIKMKNVTMKNNRDCSDLLPFLTITFCIIRNHPYYHYSAYNNSKKYNFKHNISCYRYLISCCTLSNSNNYNQFFIFSILILSFNNPPCIFDYFGRIFEITKNLQPSFNCRDSICNLIHVCTFLCG